MLMLPSPQSSFPDKIDITCQLERMLANPDFHATSQQIAILKFVVNQFLSGNGSQIKGYTVATQALGRPDYDQHTDSIVSIQAGKLRLALERYYETAGKNDPIRIDIPKGAYVPVFETMPHTRAIETSIDREHPDINVKSR
jgi:hypothetical protein